MMAGLDGRRVALLEARMSGTLAGLIRQYGGEPVSVPAVREAALDQDAAVVVLVDDLAAGAVPIIVFQTGVGATAFFTRAERAGRLADLMAALARVTTVCRGPKPAAALNRQGVHIDVAVPEPYTTADLLQALAPLQPAGQTVAVLHYGEPNASLIAGLTALGATPRELSLYEWLLPEDLGPLNALIDDLIAGRVDVIAFTSQIQARHLLQVAEQAGQAPALRSALTERVVVASVGPTTSAALRDLGLTVAVEPEHPKMGPLVAALAARYTAAE